MFFLLRMAFWLGLVLVLLPTDKAPDANQQPEVAASDAISAASAAVSDMAQFCDRQPTACTVGGQAASVIGARAQAGAKKVYQFITEKTEKADDTAEQARPDKQSDNKPDAKSEKSEKAERKPHDAKSAGKHNERRDRKSPDHTGSIDITERAADAARSDALTADDLAIEWQTPTL
ncbi:DUF5330 domain-containing protein [Afipia sp. TerB]